MFGRIKTKTPKTRTMELKGKVVKIFPKNQVTESFAKRDFVIETEDKYPQIVLMTCKQDRCSELDSIAVGDLVNCGINIDGREWTNPQGEVKYFTSINCWRISNETANDFDPQKGNFEKQDKPSVKVDTEMLAEDDGLPF